MIFTLRKTPKTTTDKKINISDLSYLGLEGQIVIKITNNKNSYLKINRKNEIIFSRSKFMSDKNANKFIQENIEVFLEKQRIKLENKPYNLDEGWVILFGKYYNLEYAGAGRGYSIEGKVIKVKGLNFESAFNNFIKKESQKIIKISQNILNYLNMSSIIKIKDLKAVWGNCTPKTQTISLSKKLVFFKEEIIEYVVYHEAAHYIHMNHQKPFWDLVAKWCPNYKKLKKQLKNW